MPNKTSNDPENYKNAPIADADIQDAMNKDIANAPRDSSELKERLDEHNASSPADSGGDIDANWEEVNTTGEEAFAGHNPTPGQSDTEKNARAYGVTFQDNEPLDLLEKMEKRDRDRWELEEASKEKGDII